MMYLFFKKTFLRNKNDQYEKNVMEHNLCSMDYHDNKSVYTAFQHVVHNNKSYKIALEVSSLCKVL